VAVRALAFDVFGTLLDWRAGISEAFRVSGAPGDPEELADGWRRRYWGIIGAVNEGARPWGNFDELHFETLDDLLAEHDLDLDLDARRRLVAAWRRLEPWPDVSTGLATLRSERNVAALSNGHLALLVDAARQADLRFDCLISADMAGVYKPEPELYRTGARLLGVQPDELMMVAAHPRDLRGARRAGLRTALVQRPFEYGVRTRERADPDADESVADLHELAERLRGPAGA
jgi:2-haloacid dehalogenase